VLTTDQPDGITIRKASISTAYFAQVAAVAVVYVLAARAGLTLDAVSGFASLVWAPTGIALAAVLLAGGRIWPGLFIGALVANLITGAPFLAASAIAAGNTLEAIVGAYALTRVPNFHVRLDSLRDVIALVVLSALLSTMISATIGVASLYYAGLTPQANVAETWRTWWIGDAIDAWAKPRSWSSAYWRQVSSCSLSPFRGAAARSARRTYSSRS
jgi:integral membrane sensor domain MASE1